MSGDQASSVGPFTAAHIDSTKEDGNYTSLRQLKLCTAKHIPRFLTLVPRFHVQGVAPGAGAQESHDAEGMAGGDVLDLHIM